MTTVMEQYLVDVQRTLSPEYKIDQLDPNTVINIMDQVISAGEWLDHLKKAIFYTNRSLPPRPAVFGDQLRNIDKLHTDAVHENLVHAAIGMVTEAVEVLQVIRDALVRGEPIDMKHLFEEIGDEMWYQALALDALNKTFEQAATANIAKLKARYPHKFDGEREANRDLEAERAALVS